MAPRLIQTLCNGLCINEDVCLSSPIWHFEWKLVGRDVGNDGVLYVSAIGDNH